jgi:hypothetical protein
MIRSVRALVWISPSLPLLKTVKNKKTKNKKKEDKNWAWNGKEWMDWIGDILTSALNRILHGFRPLLTSFCIG